MPWPRRQITLSRTTGATSGNRTGSGSTSSSRRNSRASSENEWSALTVELPENLHQKAREVAAARHLSMDALVSIALAQSLSRLVPDPYLEQRAARATGQRLKEFLAQVPDAPPPPGDEL